MRNYLDRLYKTPHSRATIVVSAETFRLLYDTSLFNRRDKETEMYIRNVRVKLRANCAPEFKRILEDEIIPLLRKQKGFRDEMFFVAPQRNEAIAISFWDKQVHAEAYNHVAYLDVLKLLSKVVDQMPVVETFEVTNSASHEMAANGMQPQTGFPIG
jgi:hypothetical protein